jgi:hypothetical protein
MRKVILIGIFLFFIPCILFAEIPIYCPHCKVHLYDYQKDEIVKGDNLLAKDFIPANKSVIQPDESTPMACPLCQCPLNLYESWAWERKVKKPVFHCWAISLLTKDKEGKWKGIPYDVIYEGIND